MTELWPIVLTSFGYALAILGTYLLVRGTPPDIGGYPKVLISNSPTEAERILRADQNAIPRRARLMRWGFRLLLVGMVVQLSGYIWGIFSMPWPPGTQAAPLCKNEPSPVAIP